MQSRFVGYTMLTGWYIVVQSVVCSIIYGHMQDTAPF